MMTRRFIDAVIKKGWQPYIKSHWLDLGKQRSGVVLTFRGHEEHEYKCSQKTANEILKEVG